MNIPSPVEYVESLKEEHRSLINKGQMNSARSKQALIGMFCRAMYRSGLYHEKRKTK